MTSIGFMFLIPFKGESPGLASGDFAFEKRFTSVPYTNDSAQPNHILPLPSAMRPLTKPDDEIDPSNIIFDRLLSPSHHRHGRNCVGWRTFDQLSANGQIDQHVSFSVKETVDGGFLEHQRRIFAEDNFVFRHFCGEDNGPDLRAGKRKLRRIFGDTESALDSAGLGLTDVAGDARDIRIVKNSIRPNIRCISRRERIRETNKRDKFLV